MAGGQSPRRHAIEVEQSACISIGARAETVTVRELGGPDASGDLTPRRSDRIEGSVRDQPDPLSVIVRELIVSRDLDDTLAIPTGEANVEIGFGIKDGAPSGPATPELPCALSFHANSIGLEVAAAYGPVNATGWPATIGAFGDAATLVAGTRTAP